MSQTAVARDQTPAVNTRSNQPTLAEPLQQAGRKRREPHPDPSPDPPRVGPSGHGGGGGGGNPNPGGNPPNPDPVPNPAPGGPPGGNPGNPGGNPGGDPGDGGDGGGGGGGGNPMDREEFLEAITTITHALRPPAPKPRAKPKAKEPDTFDGSDPRKLAAFILECKLYFRNFPEEYREDDKKINFALSYLKGPAIEWFEPWLIDSDEFDEDPEWAYDYSEFLRVLRKNYGNIDPVADAEEAIENIKMKDNWKIIRYNTEFNRHAAKLHYPDAILKRRYYKGLPTRIKDPISALRHKPDTYEEMKDAAQDYDARYWERERERSREERKSEKPKQASTPNSSNNNHRSSGTPNSGSSNPRPPNNNFASTSSTPRPSYNSSANSKAAPTTPTHIGKDGKLTPAERKRRLDAGLCLFCGASGHRVKDCPKSTSSAAKGRAATVSVDSKSKSDPKK